MEKTENVGLLKKLALVMADVSNIPKNGVNTHFGYKYVLDTDVAKAVHDAFVEHGVVMIPSMIGSQRDENNTVCRFVFTLYDAESGESIAVPWEGEAYDQQDKGINKAATAGLKYFLLKLFLISTGDLQADADAGPKKLAEGKPTPPRQSTQKPPKSEPELFVINFGKYGKDHPTTLGEIVKKDRRYVANYLVKNTRDPALKAAALAVLEKFKAEPEPAVHWIQAGGPGGANAKYHAEIKKLGLNGTQAMIILVGAKGDMREYPGTLEDAIQELKDYIESGKATPLSGDRF